MPAPTASDLIALQTDPVFLDRLILAFSTIAYATATTIVPNTPADVRFAQLNGVRFLADDSSRARELAKRSVMLVIGAPEVLASGSAVVDADLLTIAGKIMAVYAEYAAAGGKL